MDNPHAMYIIQFQRLETVYLMDYIKVPSIYRQERESNKVLSCEQDHLDIHYAQVR